MDKSFSEETMLASLRDIRLPGDAAGGHLAELLVSVGLASLGALICVLVLRMVFSPRPHRTRTRSLSQEVDDLRALPEKARRVALLHILKRHAPERFQALSKDLYAPDELDLARLEAEVARLV
jgi:hypothetical protein